MNVLSSYIMRTITRKFKNGRVLNVINSPCFYLNTKKIIILFRYEIISGVTTKWNVYRVPQSHKRGYDLKFS